MWIEKKKFIDAILLFLSKIHWIFAIFFRVSKCENKEVPVSWRKKSVVASGVQHLVRRGSAQGRHSQPWASPTTRTLMLVLLSR